MKKLFALLSAAMIICALIAPTDSFAARKSCVTLYEHINYGGKSIRLCSNDSTLVNNDWNDIASSAKVSNGNGVNLYEHINYGGDRITLRPGNYSDFRNLDRGSSNNWNDVVSSVAIR
ncbi:Beta/Gamma crystallin [Seinonella peptonophila]|uniref:Beta/Gamma crystallin n=1 Tax=Seinonella peptonophila TaxID=112248 RepID=A0A1M4SMK3_9BACL|nr:beta/gamma crystallin-related protein [Seinonella peptonophila]SHE33504.1 Beta/Gamma crystallin [Seinonella peptonophila]